MIFDFAIEFFKNLVNSVPADQRILVTLGIYTFFIVIYSIFIWKFYRFLASREVIQLNLKQYNKSKHPVIEKVFAVFLFTIEYLIILPFLVLFWFVILSLFLLLISESNDVSQILLISSAIIASTRITAYIGEDLSKDIAKILPFTILSAFLLGHSVFDAAGIFEKMMQIPSLFNHIVMFLAFIFVIEFVLRSLFSIVELFYSGEKTKEGEWTKD
jgi:hypothetical protein